MDRSKVEVVKRVYMAKKEDPLKFDWNKLVVSDFEQIDVVFYEKAIEDTKHCQDEVQEKYCCSLFSKYKKIS